MSNFKEYAQRLDETARSAFATLIDAEEELTEAEKRRRETPIKTGVLIPAEYQAKAARFESEYQGARSKHEEINKRLPDETLKTAAEIRTELQTAVNNTYAANPADLDHDVMTLLDSGILNADEYGRLLRDAKSITMRRIIAQRAGAAAETAEKSGDKETARTLRVIQNAGRDDGRAHLQNYDYLLDVLRRCLRNHAMINRWSDLTAAAIDKF